jgi:hypothetical protein
MVLIPPAVDAQQPIFVGGEVLGIADRSEIGVGKIAKLWRESLVWNFQPLVVNAATSFAGIHGNAGTKIPQDAS